MIKQVTVIISFLLLSIASHAKHAIEVANIDIIVDSMGKKELFYAFAQGDEIILTMTERIGQGIPSVQVFEHPSTLRYEEREVPKIDHQQINVPTTGIYRFCINNPSKHYLAIHVVIKRIPSEKEYKHFNSAITWNTTYDTTYTYTQERVLIRKDTAVVTLVDQLSHLAARTSMDYKNCKSVIDFQLPPNTLHWSYYIGVGDAGMEEYKKGVNRMLSETAKIITLIPEYGPMAALALQGISTFQAAKSGDNVQFYFLSDSKSAQNFQSDGSFFFYRKGNVVNDYAQMQNSCRGKCYIGLFNDNYFFSMDVLVKVTAITVTPVFEVKNIKHRKIEPVTYPVIAN